MVFILYVHPRSSTVDKVFSAWCLEGRQKGKPGVISSWSRAQWALEAALSHRSAQAKQPPTLVNHPRGYISNAHTVPSCLHSFPNAMSTGRPLSVPECAYEKEKKKPECREVAVEIIASSYCRCYQNILQRVNGFLASPRASYTNTRERMTTGWFPLT